MASALIGRGTRLIVITFANQRGKGRPPSFANAHACLEAAATALMQQLIVNNERHSHRNRSSSAAYRRGEDVDEGKCCCGIEHLHLEILDAKAVRDDGHETSFRVECDSSHYHAWHDNRGVGNFLGHVSGRVCADEDAQCSNLAHNNASS